MLTVTPSSENDDQLVAQTVLNESPLPSELEGVKIDLRDDSSGEPAIYLSFRLKTGVDLDRETIARLSRYMQSVQDRILRRGSSRFPYSSLDEAA